MSENYQFEIEKDDITALMKKNSKARTERDFEKAMQKINASTNKGIGLLFIKNRVNKLKEKLLEELEAEKESILKDSHDRKEIEKELIAYMTDIGDKLKRIVNKDEGFKVTDAYGIYNSNIKTTTGYRNSGDIILEFKHRNEVFFSVSINIKEQKGVLGYGVAATNSKVNGTTLLIQKNKKYFTDIVNQLNIPEIYKMHLVMLEFYKKNNHKNGIYGLYAIESFLRNNLSENKLYKNSNVLLADLEAVKDMVSLNSDLRLSVLSKEGLEKISK